MRPSFPSTRRIRIGLLWTAALCLAPVGAGASTISFALGSNPNQDYTAAGDPQENVGPYSGTLIVNSVVTSYSLFFCMDGNLGATFNTNPAYSGTVHVPNTQAEEEAAFLASWSLAKGAPSGNANIVNTVEGPISFAIWQIMGTLGTLKPDPAAQSYILTAQNAFSSGKLTPAYLNSVLVFVPNDNTKQRFITAVRNDVLVNGAVPEPGTLLYFGAGLLLIAASRLKKRK
jgi:hypothetical protein